MRVNMNHAATCATNPPQVIEALTAHLNEGSHTSLGGRGGDEVSALRTALNSRIALAELFGAPSPSHVVFTSGATESLNMAIHGLVRKGCHVIASSLEHNAVARPLKLLENRGEIEVSWLACDEDGELDVSAIESEIRPTTRVMILTHASNVIGNILPVEEAFGIAKKHGIFTVLDAAQTAGHIEVKLNELTDIIAFTGHKGLRGVVGSGGLVLSEAIVPELEIWKAGGTGSQSQLLEMPAFLPDRFEPGTPNTLGIISLAAAVSAINEQSLEAIRARELELIQYFMDGLASLPVRTYGNFVPKKWVPVISLSIEGVDSGVAAARLSEEFDIETRSGLHCSPLAHKTLGTFPEGTLRFSFASETSIEELDYTLKAIASIAQA